jgi:hypothetical protein
MVRQIHKHLNDRMIGQHLIFAIVNNLNQRAQFHVLARIQLGANSLETSVIAPK